jgi:aryl-alcohol dehydrogenase-like predicted oxidoreductase
MGLSNTVPWRAVQAATIAVLRGWVPLAALQLEYSLIHRDAERELFSLAKDFGMGMLGYSPLAGEILTGKYRF